MLLNYYPKNLKASGWGWHRSSGAAAVNGFLKGEGAQGSRATSGLSGGGSLYPSLPTEEGTVFDAGVPKLYPALPVEEYESGEVEEVVEEVCSAVNATAVFRQIFLKFHMSFRSDQTQSCYCKVKFSLRNDNYPVILRKNTIAERKKCICCAKCKKKTEQTTLEICVKSTFAVRMKNCN